MIVYSAGPTVFSSRILEIDVEQKKLGQALGIEVLTPAVAVAIGRCPQDTAYNIFQANLDLIDRSDAVIADISPFRGPSVDPGTAFEIGYAVAQGKHVYAYTSDMSEYSTRAIKSEAYPIVEDFDLMDNLMIVSPLSCVAKTFADALYIAKMNYRGK